MLKNREPARDWTSLVREGLLRYRRHQEQERGAPLLVTKQLFCPTADSINLRFFLSRNFARPFYFRAGGNGIRTHDTIFLYVDLANQCLKPLCHTSKLLFGIGCAGLVARRSTALAVARVLFFTERERLYPDLWISPASKRDPIQTKSATRWARPCFL